MKVAYAKGVPMGGDLKPSAGKAPQFLVWAVRDPNSGYLQRAQIVKGWVENGQAKEQVFDVACSDKLTLNRATWRCPDNGAGVIHRAMEAEDAAGVGEGGGEGGLDEALEVYGELVAFGAKVARLPVTRSSKRAPTAIRQLHSCTA